MADRQITAIIEKLSQFGAARVERLVAEVVAALQAPPPEGGTPVDTGWARANWIPSIGAPRTSPAGSYEAALAGILPDDSQRGVALVKETYRLKLGPVFITNNVPYIVKLNEGSSRQAPAGFVQAAIAKAIRAASVGV